MSGNLFLNCEKELERLEVLLRTLRTYNLSVTEHKTQAANGKDPHIYYTGTVTGKKLDSSYVYVCEDGECFPDLFQKISNKLQTP